MAITTLAGVNAALPGQSFSWMKSSAHGSNGFWWSPWLIAGLPEPGVAPSSGIAGDVPTDATLGSYPFVNPASGNTYLARISASLATISSALLFSVYDRLWHNSGISSTSTLAQVVSVSDAVAVHLTRPDANGGRVEAWWQVYASMGAGTPTVTLAYTDQSGNVETTGSYGPFASSTGAGKTGQFRLATGDTGVRSIQTWTSSATFTSGTIGLVLRRLVTSAIVSTGPAAFDAIHTGLPRIYDDACLEILWHMNTTALMTGSITLSLVQG